MYWRWTGVLLGLCAGLLAASPGDTCAEKTATLLPDLTPLEDALQDHYLLQEGDRTLLCFNTTIANIGRGPVEVRGERVEGRMRAYQVLYRRKGKPRLVPMGAFHYHRAHGHWHLLQVAEYRLRDAGGVVVAKSDKISFCLVDTEIVYPSLPGAPEMPEYNDCPKNPRAQRLRVGISVGWCDIYGSDVHGQWVDVSGLPPGEYRLEVEINPARAIRETTRKNNTASIAITLPTEEEPVESSG